MCESLVKAFWHSLNQFGKSVYRLNLLKPAHVVEKQAHTKLFSEYRKEKNG